nr:HGxxPAAW family protein [Streptomyces chartreusis]
MIGHGDDPYDLGHTVAGWTGTAIASVGFVLCGLSVIVTSGLLVATGIAVIVLAAVVTWILHLAGWGKPGGPRPVDQWDWRVKDLAARSGHPGCLGCRLAGRRAGESHSVQQETAPPAVLTTAE